MDSREEDNCCDATECDHYMGWSIQGGYSYYMCIKDNCNYIDGAKTFENYVPKSEIRELEFQNNILNADIKAMKEKLPNMIEQAKADGRVESLAELKIILTKRYKKALANERKYAYSNYGADQYEDAIDEIDEIIKANTPKE